MGYDDGAFWGAVHARRQAKELERELERVKQQGPKEWDTELKRQRADERRRVEAAERAALTAKDEAAILKKKTTLDANAKLTLERIKERARLRKNSTRRREWFLDQPAACVKCGYNNRRALVVDHVIPVSRGGADEPSNWQVLCHNCNVLKGTRMPGEQPA
jgi:predicted Zn-ribbon and HTH transcriptional regulator